MTKGSLLQVTAFEYLRAPITQVPRLEPPSFEVPDSHHLIITWDHIQSLVTPFSVFAFNIEHQSFDRPLYPDTDCVISSIDAAAIHRGRNRRNVKSERDFLGRRERKVFEWFWPRIFRTSVSSFVCSLTGDQEGRGGVEERLRGAQKIIRWKRERDREGWRV